MGYENLSPRGRLVAEYIELSVRFKVLCWRASENAALAKAPEIEMLRADIRKRYSELAEMERCAVEALNYHKWKFLEHPSPWRKWLESHVLTNPSDTVALYVLEHDFNIEAIERNRHTQLFHWRMDHPW